MKYISRPYRSCLPCLGVALLGLAVALAPSAAPAQPSQISPMLAAAVPLLHSSSPGYLGVLVGDVDQNAATRLKLKDTRGAVVTLIDHDAPAAQAGIRVNDVLLKLDGQIIESAEHFGRMLREYPAGRTVSLVISRDGNVQTIAVELADRKKMEHDVWNKIGSGGDVFTPAPQGMSMLAGGDTPIPSGFHWPFFGSSLNVGALVEPLTDQMAEYLGVKSGLMVKQVARKSDAAAAGLKAFDVILKVGKESISTVSDWDRALRANKGKTVQVTILRDKTQQTVSLQVDRKHKRGELENLLQEGGCPVIAELDSPLIDPAFAEQMQQQAEAAAEQMRQQAEKLRMQLDAMPLISQEQAEAMRQQAEKLSKSLQSQDFRLQQKQLDQMQQQMKKQMEEFKKDFHPESMKLEQLADQMRKMHELTIPALNEQQQKQLQQQMEQMKQRMHELQQQMEQLHLQGLDHMV